MYPKCTLTLTSQRLDCSNKNDSRLIEMKNDQLKLEAEGGQLQDSDQQTESAVNSGIHQGAE